MIPPKIGPLSGDAGTISDGLLLTRIPVSATCSGIVEFPSSEIAEPTPFASGAGRPVAGRTPEDVRRRAPIAFADLRPPLAAAADRVPRAASVVRVEENDGAGCGRPATVVDHRTPHNGDEALLYDWDNLQAMTKACHDRKTAARDGGFGNPVRR